MTRFTTPLLEQLADQQVRYAPPAKRREQWAAARQLLTEIDPARQYPYPFVCFRVTGYRAESHADVLIPGDRLKADLRQLIDRLDQSLPAPPIDDAAEPMLTVEQVGAMFNVSTKTVRRWAKQYDLPGRRVLCNGRKHLGFARKVVEAFAATHAERVDRGSRFSHLSEAEKHDIIRRAKRFAAAGGCLTEVSRRIARRLKRSAEAVRYTIRDHDRAHPGQELFPDAVGPLNRDDKYRIHDLYRRGIPMVAIAREYKVSRNTGHKAVREVRAERLLNRLVEYIPHASFDDPAQAAAILAEMPDTAGYEAARAALKAPRDVPPELAPLYEVPLLSKEQEQHLFRQMNYLKHQIKVVTDGLRKTDGRIDPEKVRTNDLARVEELWAKADAVKDRLIACNMRLVVSIAKRHTGGGDNFFELLSDGNVSLMRAVEKFDYSRGNKFSTYASWAIMKNFARSIPEEKVRKERYVTGTDEVFDAAPDNRSDENEMVTSAEQAAHRVNRLLEFLDPREREIIRMRAGLDNSEGMTLEQIGQRLGITKERVRQLNVRIMKKLRDLASAEGEAVV